MTDSPTLEQKKSRRGLLALVGVGGAAAAAALLGRRNGAEAASGYFDSNSATPALLAINNDAGPGVEGGSSGGTGVYGYSPNVGTGVFGESNSGYGVAGYTTSSTGVKGESVNATGVKGTGNPGVHGFGGNDPGVKGDGKPGVYGVCNKGNGSGVKGEGNAPGSIGLFGKNTPGRRALRTKGQVQMDCARKVTLSNKNNTVALPASVRAGSNAIVLAVVQGAPGNEAFVRRAFRVDSNHIHIQFDKKPANPTAVGYWVVRTG